MRKWKLWLLLGSSSFLVFFLLLVATAAGSFADDVTAAFGGRQASASESRTPIEAAYVGVDDTDTDFSGCVIPETRRWSNQHGSLKTAMPGTVSCGVRSCTPTPVSPTRASAALTATAQPWPTGTALSPRAP